MSLKKEMAVTMVLLCLTSLSTLHCVEPQSTSNIVIHPDGSVSGTAKIQHNDNLYTLTGNIYGQVLVVECNNIVVEGSGLTIQGAGGWGVAGLGGKESSVAINLTCSNVTIQNFNITGWEVGIYGSYNNNTITNNFISETRSCIAIYADNYNVVGNYLASSIDGALDRGNNDVFSKNWIQNDWQAFLIYQTSGHLITGNRIENNTEAVNTFNGEGLEIYQNNFINNQRNIAISSDAFSPSSPLGKGGGSLPPWDNGGVGNYWSNYNGPDANGDGIGDTPYIVRNDTYVIDRYPLIAPVNVPDPSIDASPVPNSIDNTNPQLSINSAKDNRSIDEMNQQQIILVTVAALVACLVVLVAIVTFRDKKHKLKLQNQMETLKKH